MTDAPPLSRRLFLKCTLAVTALAASPVFAAVEAPARSLRFYNTHTGEQATATYWADGAYVREELAAINTVLRDFRSGDVFPIDPALLDLLYTLQQRTGQAGDFHVISGYRSPHTNALLHAQTRGVAEHSLHMEGKAIDIRLPGCGLPDLHRAAIQLACGGVGYYPQSDFVHVDTGRVRYW